MKTIYNLKKLSSKITLLGSVLAICLFFYCKNDNNTRLDLSDSQMDVLQKQLNEYCNELNISTLDNNHIFIIPLYGCGNNIDVLLSVLNSNYPCDKLESSLIVFDADYPNQLIQKIGLDKESLPVCMKAHTNSGAFYKGLIQFAPVSFQLENGKIINVWYGSKPRWFKYLEEIFFIRFVKVN